MTTNWTSIPSVEQLARDQEKALGPMNSQLADTLSSLADLHFVAENFAAAESIYWRVLSIRQKTVGECHKDTAATLQSLAELYEIQDRYAEAQRFYQWATTVRKSALVKAHSDKLDMTISMDRPKQLPVMSDLKDSRCKRCNRQLLDSEVCMYCTQSGFDAASFLKKMLDPKNGQEAKQAATPEQQTKQGPVNVLVRQDSADRYLLSDTEVTIGRHPKNTIVLMQDKYVSRNHASIAYQSGDFYISDCHTTNGTYLNEQRIEGQTRIRRGDSIMIGSVTFKADFQETE